MLKYNRKFASAALLAFGGLVAGSGVAQAAVIGTPTGHETVNSSSLSINGAQYDLNPDKLIKRAADSDVVSMATLSQAIDEGYDQAQALGFALRTGLEPEAIKRAAHKLGFDPNTIDQYFGTR